MSTQHTSGRWNVDADQFAPATGSLIGIYVAHEGGGRIGQVFANCLVTEDEECRANARLFAAAPELLEALQGVLRVADRATVEFDAARAAIAKATGSAA